ncbi:hypothetical protein BC781_101516 [Sediminitomix flava]|uniref:Uncharacterized protein n=1 Tax=Sediminitomix flava TaxID=379075 RepID=A0A315ZF08_SEDFL|nr:hypothetical protein BC781_101516 [Sediminitomix flava]
MDLKAFFELNDFSVFLTLLKNSFAKTSITLETSSYTTKNQ